MFAEYCNRVREMNVGCYWFRFHAQATYCSQFWAWVFRTRDWQVQFAQLHPKPRATQPVVVLSGFISVSASACRCSQHSLGESRPFPRRHTLRRLLPLTVSSSRWGGRFSFQILKGSKLLPQILLQKIIRIASGSPVLRETKGNFFLKKKIVPCYTHTHFTDENTNKSI